MTLRTDIGASIATLALAANGSAPEWVQLFPGGDTIKAGDNRPAWKMLDVASVISASRLPLAIDYDHATDKQGGLSSRAAAWIDRIEPRGPNNESGIWGHVDWTPSGAAAVAGKEYRYLSPTFTYEKNRAITSILRAALTNDPALEMKALASKENDEVELKALCALLGLPDTATAAEVETKIKTLTQGNAAMCGLSKRVAEAAGLDVSKFVALDEPTTTALCAKLKSSVALPADADATVVRLQGEVDKLNIQVATLGRDNAGRTAAAEVDAAIAAGKLPPVQKVWGIDYCSRDPEGFRKFVAGAPVILADGRVAPVGAAADALNADEKALCAKLGVKEEDFKAERDAQRKALA